jgi:hypothetical protein
MLEGLLERFFPPPILELTFFKAFIGLLYDCRCWGDASGIITADADVIKVIEASGAYLSLGVYSAWGPG